MTDNNTAERARDLVAETIRRVDGSHRMGAAELGELIANALRAAGLLVSPPTGDEREAHEYTEASRLAEEAWAIRNEFVEFWGKHSSEDLSRVGHSPRMPETPNLDRWYPRDGSKGVAALRSAARLVNADSEGDWEYRVHSRHLNGNEIDSSATDKETAEAIMSWQDDGVERTLFRRRKAGPWEVCDE